MVNPSIDACRRCSISAVRQDEQRHPAAWPSTGITCGKPAHQQEAFPQPNSQTNAPPQRVHREAGEPFDESSAILS
jgi:hypothetical protein